MRFKENGVRIYSVDGITARIGITPSEKARLFEWLRKTCFFSSPYGKRSMANAQGDSWMASIIKTSLAIKQYLKLSSFMRRTRQCTCVQLVRGVLCRRWWRIHLF